MSDRIEELIAAGEVEFHPRKGGEFKLPSIKGRSKMFEILTPEQIGNCFKSSFPKELHEILAPEERETIALFKVAEAQLRKTAWEIVDWWWQQQKTEHDPEIAKAIGQVAAMTENQLREQGVEREG